MPVMIIRGGVAIIVAAYLFIAGLSNMQGNQIKVYNHKETRDAVIFHVAKEKTNQPQFEVIIPKDKSNGKIKISFRNKNSNVEFDFEHSGELSPEYKPYVDEIMKSITHYTKSKPTLKNKISKFIKEYVNKKL